MSGKSFEAQLITATINILEDAREVASESIQDVMEAMQTSATGISKGGTLEVGKIPVAEKELIGSLSSNGGPESADSYVLAISGYELGDTMSFAYGADHAMRKELGFKGKDGLGREFDQEGWHFMGTAARRFPEFVEKRAKEVRR